MAIQENYIDKITKDGESRPISPAADKVRVDNDNFEGDNLDDVLDEIHTAIGDAGSGDGTVTGVKVGNTPYCPDGDGVVDLSTPFNAKVDKETGKSLMTDAEHTKLQNLPTNPVQSISVNGQAQTMNNGNVNIDAYTKAQTEAKIAEAVEGVDGGTVVASVDDIDIVDNVAGENGDTILAAPSARMVKEIYLNLKALFDPESGLANLAFVGQRPTWQTVAKRHYTLTFGTLDGLDSTTPVKDAEGNAVTSGSSVNEGYLKLILKPASSSHVFTSITINGEQVASTPTGANDGSVFIEITVAGPITLAASATNGYGVSAASGSHFTLNKASIEAGTDLSVIIAAESHYTLPSSDTDVSVKIGGVTSSNFTYTRSTEQSATLTIDKQYINGNIEITIATTAMTPIAITLQGSHVTYKYDGNEISGSHNLYPDDSVRIINVSPSGDGYSISSAPVVSGCTVASDNNGGYNITIPTTVTGSLTLNISAEANFWEVTLPSAQHLSVEDGNGNALTGTQQVNKNSTFECYLLPDFLYAATVVVTMGGVDVTSSHYTASSGRVYIAQVTGDVVITATAESSNKMYKNVKQLTANLNVGTGRYAIELYKSGGFISEFIDIHDAPSITFDSDNSQNQGFLHFFDENGNFLGYFTQNARDRVLTRGSGNSNFKTTSRYVKFYSLAANVGSAVIYTDDKNNPLWSGVDVDLDDAYGAFDYVRDVVDMASDINGNNIGLVISDNYTYQICVVLGNNPAEYTGNTIVGHEFALPAADSGTNTRTIRYWLGELASSSTVAPILIVYNDLGETAKFGANTKKNGEDYCEASSIDSKYTHGRVIVKRDQIYEPTNYPMWVKDTNDNVLWSNSNFVDPNANQSEE